MTYHTGDCSTGCDRCAILCSQDGHKHCMGTAAQKLWADHLAVEEERGSDD